MTQRHETVQLRTPEPGDLGAKPLGDFASVRVGGAIDGHQITGALAEGGMGAVFRAVERNGEAEVALKTPLPGGRGGTYHHRMRRFLREARLTARMHHAGVARVREQGQCEGLPYFTLDLIDGVPLSDRLYREGVLPVAEAVEIVEKTARAAHHVHQQGVVHRDLKPANILLKDDGTPVIIDFGLARDAFGIDPRITESGIWLGTPAYIAPEQALGEASRVDARADVYSLGAILYELITGLPPHGVGSPRAIFKALRRDDPKPPSELRPVPADLDVVVLKALSREHDERYPNAEAFANALADLLPGLDEAEDELEDEADASGLECSWDTEGSGAELAASDTVLGWNESHTPVVIELEPAPAGAPAVEERPTKKARRARRRARARRRSSGRTRALRARGVRGRRPSEGLDAMARYLAFCGPALVALLGLLLLV